jgi:hypothetical protein
MLQYSQSFIKTGTPKDIKKKKGLKQEHKRVPLLFVKLK